MLKMDVHNMEAHLKNSASFKFVTSIRLHLTISSVYQPVYAAFDALHFNMDVYVSL